MPRKTIKNLKILICLRCGYEWVPRIAEEPKRCAGCKSMYWNKEIENESASDKVREFQNSRWAKIRGSVKTNKKGRG